ncbi:MAG: peptidoglycan DD-metalloendopeptidase family protein [Pedobacter sp.]|nr:peptidoglycan DD-metalloendopeptidase family protein [Pedobacter sp.]MDQ8054480.1 peptidoglycan DD-metalloendopeptidase family protein [Pedobacter sp.]
MKNLVQLIEKYRPEFAQVVDFDPAKDQLMDFDLTANNTALTSAILNDTLAFSQWVSHELSQHGAKYGIGGYNEHRTIYSRSEHFDSGEEPRRLHLGIDIWGPAGTPIYNFYEGKVHSFKFNDNFGDYGATIILQYELEGVTFFALYGHLSLDSLTGLFPGKPIASAEQFATFGIAEENGHWPPHLHLQLIRDMQGFVGDYPGVCQFSKRPAYLDNCPDPSPVLGLVRNTY